jgi:hypothetical protein
MVIAVSKVPLVHDPVAWVDVILKSNLYPCEGSPSRTFDPSDVVDTLIVTFEVPGCGDGGGDPG